MFKHDFSKWDDKTERSAASGEEDQVLNAACRRWPLLDASYTKESNAMTPRSAEAPSQPEESKVEHEAQERPSWTLLQKAAPQAVQTGESVFGSVPTENPPGIKGVFLRIARHDKQAAPAVRSSVAPANQHQGLASIFQRLSRSR